MVKFGPDLDSMFKTVQAQLDPDIIYTEEDYGLETEPHVTVIYGLDPELASDEVRKASVERVLADGCVFPSLGVFEQEEYDVIFLEVFTTDWLSWLHDKVKDQFQVEETYDEYKPHMTLAYVKPGMGKDAIKQIELANELELFFPKEMVWSIEAGKKTWPLLLQPAGVVDELIGA